MNMVGIEKSINQVNIIAPSQHHARFFAIQR